MQGLHPGGSGRPGTVPQRCVVALCWARSGAEAREHKGLSSGGGLCKAASAVSPLASLSAASHLHCAASPAAPPWLQAEHDQRGEGVSCCCQ